MVLMWQFLRQGRRLNAIKNALTIDQMNYMVIVKDQNSVATQTQDAICQQKADLKQARQHQHWNQECEELRHETMAYSTKKGISSDCQQLEQYFLKLESDNVMLDTSLSVQKKQHALLVHCLEGANCQSTT